MIRLAMIGAGRIGQVHARNIRAGTRARLVYVADPNPESANAITEMTGAVRAGVDVIENDASINAFLICSPTSTHSELLLRLSKLDRPIFCEKPISLDIAQARECADLLRARGTRGIVGFHRRFDPAFSELRSRIRSGYLGAVYQIAISSRSWTVPPEHYIRDSGGLFRDQTIHDFDMMRFLTDEEAQSVYAIGDCRIDPSIARLNDIDCAMTTIKSVSGIQIQINNGRFAAYGYDQRLEVFGLNATAIVENKVSIPLSIGRSDGVRSSPFENTFVERYRDAYRLELEAFLDLVEGHEVDAADFDDAIAAQELAEAALLSHKSGMPIALEALSTRA